MPSGPCWAPGSVKPPQRWVARLGRKALQGSGPGFTSHHSLTCFSSALALCTQGGLPAPRKSPGASLASSSAFPPPPSGPRAGSPEGNVVCPSSLGAPCPALESCCASRFSQLSAATSSLLGTIPQQLPGVQVVGTEPRGSSLLAPRPHVSTRLWPAALGLDAAKAGLSGGPLIGSSGVEDRIIYDRASSTKRQGVGGPHSCLGAQGSCRLSAPPSLVQLPWGWPPSQATLRHC